MLWVLYQGIIYIQQNAQVLNDGLQFWQTYTYVTVNQTKTEYFHRPIEYFHVPLSMPFSPPLQAASSLVSITVGISSFLNPYKWNHATCVLLSLAPLDPSMLLCAPVFSFSVKQWPFLQISVYLLSDCFLFEAFMKKLLWTFFASFLWLY